MSSREELLETTLSHLGLVREASPGVLIDPADNSYNGQTNSDEEKPPVNSKRWLKQDLESLSKSPWKSVGGRATKLLKILGE
jgi:hypothetical protein